MRIEVSRVLRYREDVKEAPKVKEIFSSLQSKNLSFVLDVEGLGATLRECRVLSVDDSSVTVFARYPQKVKRRMKFPEIKRLEVESNTEVREELDDGGRWDQLM